MPIEIRAVSGRDDLRDFVGLPFRLHRGTPWIPPLKLERYAFLTRKLNAFFTHGEAKYFLARRDGRVVGRITAQIDFAFNQHHGSRSGMFGFLEFEDDQEIIDALIAAAEGWCRARGCDRMLGPMCFQLNDDAGIMIEGFEREPLIREPWSPPYYQQRAEQAGLAKAMDLYGWDLDISDRKRINPALPRIAERARTKHGITIRRMSRLHLRREMDEFAKIYNAAWSHNWGFVPFSKADLDAYTLDMQLVFSRDWYMIAEQNGKTIAVAITIPDIHQVYKKMNGRLLPFGGLYYLLRGRIIDRVRVGFLGVLPEYQHTGVAAALYLEHFDTANRSRQKTGEASFILEINTSMNRGLEAMGARLVKRWRVYERLLEPGAAPSAPASNR
ncbi:MAG: GNAT family N-acetyltransferase [Solirubrobacteraceae bacterium]